MSEEKKKPVTINDEFDLSKLNKKETTYFRMIYPKSGVPFFYSEPGIAKSATMRGIAEKLDLFYIDIRLSMLDETDVGLFPNVTEMTVTEDGKELLKSFLDHVVPKWAYLANNPTQVNKKYKGTLIHFEELNRAPLAVRNAALQILLERCIGYEFAFNENVYMVSTGNMGEEDGTDVEEFDSALNGRLLHMRHELSMDEWFEYYANDNIQNIIVRYLTAHPDHFYKKDRSEEDKAYASPRSWTFLSDFITKNYGYNSSPKEWISMLQLVAHSSIGSSATPFLRYLRDTMKIGINDIINRYPELKGDAEAFNRDKKAELLSELKQLDVTKFKANQVENVKQFIVDLQPDECVSYLLKLIDEDYNIIEDVKLNEEQNKNILSFLRDKRFVKYHEKIDKHTNPDED